VGRFSKSTAAAPRTMTARVVARRLLFINKYSTF
jgi:hypothetical protein